jgi:glycine/D-amino acid oxidase-like deaminating enzyme
MLVSGLGRAAVARGAFIFENSPIDDIDFSDRPTLHVRGQRVRSERILIATNAESLEINGLAPWAEPKLTLATATDHLSDEKLRTLGLVSSKPFYTIDLPYLWGRLLNANQIIFGSGLVSVHDWRDLTTLDVRSGEPHEVMNRLEKRIAALHPALTDVEFTHRWAGPILITEDWRPIFAHHRKNSRALVLGAYSGHGVALSVYLGHWAAEVLLDKKAVPTWNSTDVP